MSWRTVVVSSRCKLDLKMGYMVIRGEDTKRIFLDEMALLVIENPAVSLTGCLLEALVEKKVRGGLLRRQAVAHGRAFSLLRRPRSLP